MPRHLRAQSGPTGKHEGLMMGAGGMPARDAQIDRVLGIGGAVARLVDLAMVSGMALYPTGGTGRTGLPIDRTADGTVGRPEYGYLHRRTAAQPGAIATLTRGGVAPTLFRRHPRVTGPVPGWAPSAGWGVRCGHLGEREHPAVRRTPLSEPPANRCLERHLRRLGARRRPGHRTPVRSHSAPAPSDDCEDRSRTLAHPRVRSRVARTRAGSPLAADSHPTPGDGEGTSTCFLVLPFEGRTRRIPRWGSRVVSQPDHWAWDQKADEGEPGRYAVAGCCTAASTRARSERSRGRPGCRHTADARQPGDTTRRRPSMPSAPRATSTG